MMKNKMILLLSLYLVSLRATAVLGFVPRSSQQRTSRSLLHSTVEESKTTKGEPMPWTLNQQAYGEFDQENDWSFAYSTTPDEALTSYVCDNIEGTIPTDLTGTYYKVGPGNFEREGRRYNHVLDGDGFVSAFSFDNGQVKYTGRFVETEYYLKEKEKDQILYRNVFGTQRKGGALANAFDVNLKNVANTNVIDWGGRLFVLWEAGRPYELDRETLATLDQSDSGPYKNLGQPDCKLRSISIDDGGPVDEAMKMGRSFTAHPHVLDDDTLIAFKAAQNPISKDMQMEFVEYDRDWSEKKNVRYSLEQSPAAPHDYSIANDYYCFFQNRLGLDKFPYLLGMKSPTQVLRVLLNESTILHLVPRSPTKKALKFSIPSYFNIHTVPNVEQDGNKFTIYSNGWNLKDERFFPKNVESVPFLGSWGGAYPDFLGGVVPPSHLYRTVVDLETEQVESHDEVFPGLVMEWPLQDEVSPEIMYCSVASENYESLPGTGLCKVDLKRNTAEYWWAENRIFTHEVSPVPKRNGDKGSWLLTMLYDADKRRTTLAIFDSERFEDGPVARIHLPHHLSYGLHGFFAQA